MPAPGGRHDPLRRLAEWWHDGTDAEPGARRHKGTGPLVELELGTRAAKVLLRPHNAP